MEGGQRCARSPTGVAWRRVHSIQLKERVQCPVAIKEQVPDKRFIIVSKLLIPIRENKGSHPA